MNQYYSADSLLELRIPTADDGAAVFNLINECPPLDPNSLYCNLLQCSHFAETSVAAVKSYEMQGFVSGYIIPQRPDTLYIWQVAVAQSARGQGLAPRMILNILSRPNCVRVTHLEASVTDSNEASWQLFAKLSNQLGGQLKTTEMFTRDKHFKGTHETETLVRIGPFNSQIVEFE